MSEMTATFKGSPPVAPSSDPPLRGSSDPALTIRVVATLADRIRHVSDLTGEEADHLRALCSSWQVLADLSFSDLLLYVPLSMEQRGADVFAIAAQLRPFTSQTLYPQDMVGMRVTQPEQPIVERAYREGRIWAQSEPVLVDGIPIRMDAVPVRFGDRVIAVVTKEGSPATSRRPGRLEQVYLSSAEIVSRMICNGDFPYPEAPAGDWPRVGDGLFVLDEAGRVNWASPNALSSLRRLDIKHNVLGRCLDDLGLGATLSIEVEQLREDGYQVDYEENLGDQRLPDPVEIALFRIAQEALNNVRKHAQALRVRIRLGRSENEAHLKIQDYGRGFDTAEASTGSGPGERVGLAGMRERVSLLGGELEIDSRPATGTSISVTVPLVGSS